ncbi:hypothetical protein Poli38472_008501 [Pythium oligandrum]|uniref:Aspartate racemase n=1 Tax=Pythium oligandrum TaxID=41045 RepID=A0A8K1C3V2_PYTOL|nr:hypothetical protein Poli38472_008501 [Pythium oligandrum]|eukprot:TMW55853.1 hypothetical protein Poli38472_008501 [Pythium oligandrum]
MGKDQEVMIAICGGVGPAAGLLLHQIILENTENDGEDQGHLNVCHFSRSEDMTDRTEYLLNSTEDEVSSPRSTTESASLVENPACGMARTLEMMRAGAAQGKVRLVVGVPCNTFHAKPIWNEFLRLTKAGQSENIRYVHMLEETVQYIAKYAPTSRRIGLMATTGTRTSRVYHDLMGPLGFKIIEVPQSMQKELHESVYNKTWGIKSTAPAVKPRCVANFHRYARMLHDLGAEVIVMGCTEIPFAFTGKRYFGGCLLIDPMVALARALIREADPKRLKRLEVESVWPSSISTISPRAGAAKVTPTKPKISFTTK